MKKTLIKIVIVVIALWLVIGLVDYNRVYGFEKPIFCIATNTVDDGGSGHCIGLGYSFDIEGNFMPEDEFPGVTKWTYYWFGIEVQTQIRDGFQLWEYGESL